MVVLRIDSGIVAIPLFKIDVPLSSKSVRLGSEFSGTETDDEVESGNVFGPLCLSTRGDFGCGEVLEIPVVSDHINGVVGTFEIVLPSFKGFIDSEQLFVMNIVVVFWGMECVSGKQLGASCKRSS